MTAAFTFPGQGSQAVGMGKALAEAFPVAKAVFDEVDAALGDRLTAIIWEGPAETLQLTGYADACPIATVALEVASTNEPLRRATADVFESWIASATTRFAAEGVEQAGARALAIAMIGALEGAFVLSRALRSTEPLEVAGAHVAAAVEAALGS